MPNTESEKNTKNHPEDSASTPEQREQETRARLRQEAKDFIQTFPIPETHTTPNGVVLDRDQILAELQRIFDINPQYDSAVPSSRVNQLRESALHGGMNDRDPIYHHVPSLLEAYLRNERALPEAERALTLPATLDIIALALKAEISGLSKQIALWANPAVYNMLMYPGLDGADTQLDFTMDTSGSPILNTVQRQINSDRTGHEDVPGSQKRYTPQDLADKGLNLDSEWVTKSYQELQYCIATLQLYIAMLNRADWLRVGLIDHNVLW